MPTLKPILNKCFSRTIAVWTKFQPTTQFFVFVFVEGEQNRIEVQNSDTQMMFPFKTDSISSCLFFLLLLLLVVDCLLFIDACSTGSCQVFESCSATSDCGSGLYCGNCPAEGRDQPVCMRGLATKVTSYVDGLPFNKYTWLVTHNSFSIVNAPQLTGNRVTFYNQEDTVTNQLMNGVRGLMLDMYDYDNDIWLCHSFQGQCYNFTAFEPAINTLREVEAFLSSNPTEIVTIFIEDYVHTPKGLTNLFTNSGLLKYWFPVKSMPMNGRDWPTVTEMVKNNQRLLVFTSVESKQADEGIAYLWNYMVENEPGDNGIKECVGRKESQPLSSKGLSLVLENYFPTFPDQGIVCKEHSASLVDMVNTCYKAAGYRKPNFLAVNFYMRSDGGGVFDIIDGINGETLCGCNSVVSCQASASGRTCNSANSSNPGTPSLRSNSSGDRIYSGTIQFTGLSSAAAPMYVWPFFRGVSLLVVMVFHCL